MMDIDDVVFKLKRTKSKIEELKKSSFDMSRLIKIYEHMIDDIIEEYDENEPDSFEPVKKEVQKSNDWNDSRWDDIF